MSTVHEHAVYDTLWMLGDVQRRLKKYDSAEHTFDRAIKKYVNLGLPLPGILK
jgi:TolA-binding protein